MIYWTTIFILITQNFVEAKIKFYRLEYLFCRQFCRPWALLPRVTTPHASLPLYASACYAHLLQSEIHSNIQGRIIVVEEESVEIMARFRICHILPLLL